MEWKANWIKAPEDMGDVCPVFKKEFTLAGEIREAQLFITGLGIYEAVLNGQRISDFVLAPGWTSYSHRLQYQRYDVTSMLASDNVLTVTLGKGWYRSPLGWGPTKCTSSFRTRPAGIIAQLSLSYQDGSSRTICTDESWETAESQIRFSEIYDGETYDASFAPSAWHKAQSFQGPTEMLIPQEGEKIREQERLMPRNIFRTPSGETVVDFGQNITGYVEVRVNARAGNRIRLSHAEVLDQQGNFYTANYRKARANYLCVCRDGEQVCKPRLTFYGFRYIRIDEFPGGPERAEPDNFTAIAVHSSMERTGWFRSSHPLLNRLYENIIWGQKGNFLDVPTDCPQRDERLGWTGDAQVFMRTSCLNYDVETFFSKWLADMRLDQAEDGRLCHVIPAYHDNEESSAAWGDAATICPWELYLAYGNLNLLRKQFTCMKKWVDYIGTHTTTADLWTGGTHFGDWLGLDSPPGSRKGSSREDFIATCFYARSTELVIKAGCVLGEAVEEYEALYHRIRRRFQQTWPEPLTQTECVLAAHFNLACDCQAAANRLAGLIHASNDSLQTGFVGTPYLLHVLSAYGHGELAWTLLLRQEYPSWLYPVTKGATTVWEHWDGIMPDGSFWSTQMNSFNHYAYGSVADWLYNVAAGISPLEDFPGYSRIRIAPHPDPRLDWMEVTLSTRLGTIRSYWTKQDGGWRYEIQTPVAAEITIAGTSRIVERGSYVFYS